MTDTDQDFTPDALEAAGGLGGSPDPGYSWPTDPRTVAALEHWRDLKVGVIIHWGIYAAIGQGGSWSLHRGDLGDFTDPPEDWTGSDAEYQTWYADQARTFTGVDYRPEEWARACADAGMKYLVFTTKHHDGFCLWDTDFTNFKSTAEDAGLGRDVVAETFEAFRGEGLETGAYFSKADWSHPGYWDRSRPITDRFHNYDIAERPAKWESFVRHTHDQVDELLSRYGRISVLWLDAGWTRDPVEPIRIDDLAARAHELQPDILVVDREVHGPNENYRTPEQALPDQLLEHPWESCITMTRSWCSLSPDEPAKPTAEVVATLVRIVGRGGNYLIGIGPDATGAMPPAVANGLRELGEWLGTCGPAVYGTRAAAGFQVGDGCGEWHLTRRDDELFALGLPDAAGRLPERLRLVGPGADRAARAGSVLGGGPVSGTVEGDGCRIDVGPCPTPHAVAVRLPLR